MSEQSTEIAKLAAALSKAQGKITGALKDSSNPFFKSKYADLAACWDACRTQLSENGLSIIQTTDLDDQGVTVVTTLAHESGEWIRGKLRMMPKDASPQGIGSCITYARRYALAGMVGLAQIDDDANAASGRGGADPRGEQPAVDEKLVSKYVDRFNAAFGLDKEEGEIASAVFTIHSEICTNEALYIAVGDKLGHKGKTAIREYLKINAKHKSPSVNGRAAA